MITLDLIAAYFNRPGRCDDSRQLPEALADEPRYRRSVRSNRPRQPRGRERLTSAGIASLVESFQDGTSKRELAQRYGISESTVKRLLHARGARGKDKPICLKVVS